VLIALAPAYWIWDDTRVLLVVQALLLAGTSLPGEFGPYAGLPGSHKDQVKGETGSVRVEWTLKE